jgi:hypothetical protein
MLHHLGVGIGQIRQVSFTCLTELIHIKIMMSFAIRGFFIEMSGRILN